GPVRTIRVAPLHAYFVRVHGRDDLPPGDLVPLLVSVFVEWVHDPQRAHWNAGRFDPAGGWRQVIQRVTDRNLIVQIWLSGLGTLQGEEWPATQAIVGEVHGHGPLDGHPATEITLPMREIDAGSASWCNRGIDAELRGHPIPVRVGIRHEFQQ